jgi:inosose dehydratase
MNTIFGSQMYPWSQFYGNINRDYHQNLDEVLGKVRACGFDTWEQTVGGQDDYQQLKTLLPKHNLQLVSIYDNLRLHDDNASQVIERAVENAKLARELGAQVFVINPEPIDWNNPVDKDDAQLRTEAHSMQVLGEKLRALDMWLAFHIHAPEMRQSAREFHHVLLNTSPDAVGLCLDTHWIYRGAGDSEVALLDIMTLYANRVKSLHLRQSQGGIWAETFGDGDIEYSVVVKKLRDANFSGPIILEQALEGGTPHTMNFEEAQQQGLEYAKQIFAA